MTAWTKQEGLETETMGLRPVKRSSVKTREKWDPSRLILALRGEVKG